MNTKFMNRKIVAAVLTLSLITLGLQPSLQARGRVPQKRYQVNVTWGGYSSGMLLESSISHPYDLCFSSSNKANESSLSSLYSSYRGPVRTTGIVSADFVYHFRTWFSLEASLGYDCVWARNYSADTGAYVGFDTEHYIDLSVMARFTWVNRRYFRGYSAVGLCGVVGGPYADMAPLYVLPQLDFVGLEVGSSVFGLLEFGLGGEYCGAKIGIGYRF